MDKTIEESMKSVNKKQSFKEYMSGMHHLNRWGVLLIGIIGAFCGALVAIIFMLFGFK